MVENIRKFSPSKFVKGKNNFIDFTRAGSIAFYPGNFRKAFIELKYRLVIHLVS